MEPEINFQKLNGLVPCVILDATTSTVLMVGFMNAEAYKKTKLEKRVTFYSRTKGSLWTKGSTSGNFLDVVSIHQDCDNDSLLIKVNPHGPVCHTGADTCFSEKNERSWLMSLEQLIRSRQQNPLKGSYTSELFESGINRIAQKLGEEAVELVIESKDNNKPRFLEEAGDLVYHLLVLLAAKDVSIVDVENVLAKRHKQG